MWIGSTIICHLSKVWKAKFFILSGITFLVSCQEKFEINHRHLPKHTGRRLTCSVMTLKCNRYTIRTRSDTSLSKKSWANSSGASGTWRPHWGKFTKPSATSLLKQGWKRSLKNSEEYGTWKTVRNSGDLLTEFEIVRFNCTCVSSLLVINVPTQRSTGC